MKPGFTLLELLVVLVIIGVVTVFVAPKMAGSLANMNLKTASREISASLRYARDRAVSSQQPWMARFDLEKGELAIKPKKDESEKREEEPEELERKGHGGERYELPGSVRIEKAVVGEEEMDSGSFEFLFFPSGSSSGGRIVLINEREWRSSIEADFVTGLVKVHDLGKEG